MFEYLELRTISDCRFKLLEFRDYGIPLIPSFLHRLLTETKGNKGVKSQFRWKQCHSISFADLCMHGGTPAIYHDHLDPVVGEAKPRDQIFNSRSWREFHLKLMPLLPYFFSKGTT